MATNVRWSIMCQHSVSKQGIISIASIVQGYRYIALPESANATGYGASEICQININCPQGQNWQEEKNAVALILVDGFRYCTGALLNTTANDNKAYLLLLYILGSA
ncbi:hypothetical protein FACS189429_0140 [Bacteroidia bacterium]|nr:hypothetical protein FACS189429_0140 [Bacteroidia bacterium]